MQFMGVFDKFIFKHRHFVEKFFIYFIFINLHVLDSEQSNEYINFKMMCFFLYMNIHYIVHTISCQ